VFDLFKLHFEKEDLFPESWICFEGYNINIILNNLVKELCFAYKTSHYQIGKKIAHKTGLCISAVLNYLRYKNHFPIPLMNSIIVIWSDKLKKKQEDIEEVKKKILTNIKYLKLNNSLSVKIKPLSKIDKHLAYFLGAHAADGMISIHVSFANKNKKNLKKFKCCLEKYLEQKIVNNIYFDNYKKVHVLGISVNNELNKKVSDFLANNTLVASRKLSVKREFRWKLVDGHCSSVKQLRNIIKYIFALNLKLKEEKNSKAFKLETKNKILVRYLHCFFEFPYGKKSRIVDEPNVLKKSNLSKRNAFLRGVFTFDGSITRNGTISLQLYSEPMISSIKEILSKNSMTFKCYATKRKSFCIQKQGKSPKWLFVFEKRTEKWKKLNFIIKKQSNIKCKDKKEFIEQLSEIYPKNASTKISIENLFKICKLLKVFDLEIYCDYLEKNLNIKITKGTLLRNLEILERSKILNRSKKTKYFLRKKGRQAGTKGAVIKNILKFNPKISEWVLPY